MRTFYVSADFPLNRRMRKDIRRGKLRIVREGEGENGGGVEKAHVWRPIEDMPAAFDEKAQTAENELRELSAKWQERRAEMNPDERAKFDRELNREWAIETGLIERAYYLERGETQTLIERGFMEGLIPRRNGQDPAEVVCMLRDHENVLGALYDFAAGDRELSVGYIKELHAEMLCNQKTVVGKDQFGNTTRIPMNHGKFKMRPNNPHTPEGKLHEYCPWEQVDSEMDRLIEMHKTHSAHSALARAAWLHHRFVQIHPFEDGNGRIARCLASVVLLRGGLFPMVVMNEEREKYLDALDDANRGNLSPFVCCLAEWQKRYYLKLFPAEQVREAERKLQAIRDIPAVSVANLLLKIEGVRDLVLQADEHIRSGKVMVVVSSLGESHSGETHTRDALAKLGEIRSLFVDPPQAPAIPDILSGFAKLVEFEGQDAVSIIEMGNRQKPREAE